MRAAWTEACRPYRARGDERRRKERMRAARIRRSSPRLADSRPVSKPGSSGRAASGASVGAVGSDVLRLPDAREPPREWTAEDRAHPGGLRRRSRRFREQGEKPRGRWRVGTEHEKIGLQRGSLRPVPYEGENGIDGVLAAVAAEDGWSEVREDGALIALEGEGASITLEPGGQLELSGAPLRTIFETCEEFHATPRRDPARLGAAAASCGSRSACTRSTTSHETSRACRRRATTSCASTCRRAASSRCT